MAINNSVILDGHVSMRSMKHAVPSHHPAEEIERLFLSDTALQVSGPPTMPCEPPRSWKPPRIRRTFRSVGLMKTRLGQLGCHDWRFQRRDRVLDAARPPISAKLQSSL